LEVNNLLLKLKQWLVKLLKSIAHGIIAQILAKFSEYEKQEKQIVFINIIFEIGLLQI